VQRHAKDGDRAAAKNGSVPVILITYATSEDAVRKALAAVGRDRVISGRPQVIRMVQPDPLEPATRLAPVETAANAVR